MRKERPVITFLIDTREQQAYDFFAPRRRELGAGGSLRVKLDEGDYAARLGNGEPLPIRIERKAPGDLFGVVGHGRKRFEAELERLARHEMRILLIEATPRQILNGYEQSMIRGEVALASVLAWMVRYGLSVVFADDRMMARAFCQRLLEQAAIEHLRLTGK